MSTILNTNHLDQSIEITHDQKVAAADPQYVKYPAGEWNVSNPHPGFGVDPNIKNELGHTEYPKMIYPNGRNGPGVVVNSAAEEANYIELNPNGPTIQEYVAKGYKASTYPPQGYASKSTSEEIKEFVDRETVDPWK